jgi:hypothetical protein
MRILDLLNFEALRSRISSPDLLLEYKRFLALKVALGDFDASVLSPPAEIDAIWHAHILDTKHYRTVCEALGQGFIEHDPDGGADPAARDTRRMTCLAEYKKEFGAVPDAWAKVRPALAPRALGWQALQPPQTQAKKARRRPPAAQPAQHLPTGSYILVKHESIGRGGRRVMRPASGSVIRKHNDEWAIICLEGYTGARGDIKVIGVNEKHLMLQLAPPCRSRCPRGRQRYPTPDRTAPS